MNGGAIAILLGSRAAELALLHLFHYGETYGRAVSQDMEISLESVQRQLDKLERSGILVSKTVGRTRLYLWNLKSPLAVKFRDFVQVAYEGIPPLRRAEIFTKRRRPRRKGKSL